MSVEVTRRSGANDYNIDAIAVRQRRISVGSAEPPVVGLLRQLLSPLIAAIVFAALVLVHGRPLDTQHVALGLLVFLTTSQLVRAPRRSANVGAGTWLRERLLGFLFEWCCVVGVLVFVGAALGASSVYSPALFWQWAAITPATIIAAQSASAWISTRVPRNRVHAQRHIVIGANEVGLELNRRAHAVCNSRFMGFFDDREAEDLAPECRKHLAGASSDVMEFVQRHAIDTIYISLPLSALPGISQLLSDLRDTAASVYVLPDIFSFDVIQARFVDIDGMPAVSLYDTPFYGANALVKRATDITFAVLAVLCLWPALLAIAVGVKLSSPGPVIFRQRRYGLNGEEIVVYKFRTMTVCEDGAQVFQARRADARVTPFGSFLRRTSLDELPQILNILEGKMSVVGPRPHAVAHNEQYRKLISGYMFRHKVRPGMTGWAQVNGLRGQTETVEKMRQRVEYDLDYLRNWSFWLDVKIVFRTLKLLLSDAQAY